jgi:hypothetical protein
MPRRVPPSAFEERRSSSNVSCRLAHVVASQLLRAALASGQRAEDDFRRAAPAAASRQVEHALNEDTRKQIPVRSMHSGCPTPSRRFKQEIVGAAALCLAACAL